MATWAAIKASWLFTDKFGNPYQGSSFQVFTSYNSMLNSIGLPSVTSPSAVFVPSNLGAIACAINHNGLPSMVFVSWANVAGANDNIAVFASPPMSQGRNGRNAKLTQLIGKNVNGVSFADAGTQYLNTFGIPPVGSLIRVVVYVRDGRWPANTQKADLLVTVT